MNALARLRQRLSAWAIRLVQRFGPHRARVLGRTFRINRHVFNPRAFLTSKFMARHLDVRPTDSVLDMGTGSGIQAIVAAATAGRVVAVDINPEAIRLARENARANGVADRVTVLEGDLFAPLRGGGEAPCRFRPPTLPSPLPEREGGEEEATQPLSLEGEGRERVTVLEGDLFGPLRGAGCPSAQERPQAGCLCHPEGRPVAQPISAAPVAQASSLWQPEGMAVAQASSLCGVEAFDVILLNPPYLEGPVRSLLGHAMFDPGRRLHRRFFAEAGAFLAPGGCVLMVCSSLAEPAQALAIADELGWDASLVRQKRVWCETLFLYRLTPRPARPRMK